MDRERKERRDYCFFLTILDRRTMLSYNKQRASYVGSLNRVDGIPEFWLVKLLACQVRRSKPGTPGKIIFSCAAWHRGNHESKKERNMQTARVVRRKRG